MTRTPRRWPPTRVGARSTTTLIATLNAVDVGSGTPGYTTEFSGPISSSKMQRWTRPGRQRPGPRLLMVGSTTSASRTARLWCVQENQLGALVRFSRSLASKCQHPQHLIRRTHPGRGCSASASPGRSGAGMVRRRRRRRLQPVVMQFDVVTWSSSDLTSEDAGQMHTPCCKTQRFMPCAPHLPPCGIPGFALITDSGWGGG